MQDWFVDTFGEEYVFQVPDWAVIEHSIEYQASIFAYDPDDAGYSWDAEKAETLRNKYTEIAVHIETLS